MGKWTKDKDNLHQGNLEVISEGSDVHLKQFYNL